MENYEGNGQEREWREEINITFFLKMYYKHFIDYYDNAWAVSGDSSINTLF